MKQRAAFRRRVRRCLFLLSAAVAAALLHGCGLETVVLLNAPHYADVSGVNSYFKFRIQSDNDENEFRGIEIYYKFYLGLPSATELSLSAYSDLLAAGFRRLSSTSDTRTLTTLPLIPVDAADRGNPSTITLDFSPLANALPSVPAMSATPDTTGLTLAATEFRRGVWSASDGSTKRFYDLSSDRGFASADDDIRSLGLSQGPNDVSIAVYALSYGVQDLVTPIYSRAVPLTYIQITIDVVG